MSSPKIIITGHNAQGLSTFVDNLTYKNFSPHVGIIYSAKNGDPIDLNNNADISEYERRDHAGLIPKHGSVVIVVEWLPLADSISKIHRTLSVDVGVVIQGQIICQLDSGESHLIKQGDVLLQRGTMYA